MAQDLKWQDEMRKRQQAATMQAAQMYGRVPGQIQQAYQTARTAQTNAMRQQAARALAGSISRGNISGGAAIGAAQDAGQQYGLQVGAAMADSRLSEMDALNKARSDAATAQIEALDRIRDLGTSKTLVDEQKAEAKEKLSEMHTKYTEGMWDDEVGMRDAMYALADEYDDPDVKKYIKSEADRYYKDETTTVGRAYDAVADTVGGWLGL